MRGEIIEFSIIKQIKKPQVVLCSVVKHLGSSRALEKWEKTLDCVSCFPLHFFHALPLPACFTTEHSKVEASLFVKEEINSVFFCYILVIFLRWINTCTSSPIWVYEFFQPH